ncbi:hypothetical protein BDR03DRAFT_529346 [Suillus americanus]|nr:hypothetical protein BDR03DRAFT_529346 [Suillus americanus]
MDSKNCVTNWKMLITSFSKVDPMTLLSLKISSGPFFLISDKRRELENLGLDETPGCLPIDTTRFLISLVRGHVAMVTEAGCRILINMLLLRVVSVICQGDTAVNIISEFPLPTRTTFNRDSGKCSFIGVVDSLVTELPARYTEYLLGDPTTALENPGYIEGPMMSNIFEAKRDHVRTTLPQAAIAAASYCQLQGLFAVRGVVTSGEQWVPFVYESLHIPHSLVT